MAKVEVDTLTPNCFEYCDQMDIASRADGTLGCSKKFICKCGAWAYYNMVLEKFETELNKASLDITGLKEPAVWKKAIGILEDCYDER